MTGKYLDILSDGNWHNFMELLSRIGNDYPAEVATRHNYDPDKELAGQVRSGRRMLVVRNINNLLHTGKIACRDETVKQDYREYKLATKEKKMTFGEMELAIIKARGGSSEPTTPQQRYPRISVRVPQALIDRMQREARAMKTTLGAIVRRTLEENIGQD